MTVQHYRPETYRSRESVGYLVRRLYTVWLEHFERALAHAGLTLTQWIVLIQLRDGFVRTASDIAHELKHDSGALTRVLDQLERRGLLVRQRSARDRRVVELELTAAGESVVRDSLPLVVERTNAALEPLSRREFEQFRGFLVRILEHAQGSPVMSVPAGSPESAPVASERRKAAPRTAPKARAPARKAQRASAATPRSRGGAVRRKRA